MPTFSRRGLLAGLICPLLFEKRELRGLLLPYYINRVLSGKAGVTETPAGLFYGGVKAFDGEVPERIGCDVIVYLLYRLTGRYELVPPGGVYTVIARGD